VLKFRKKRARLGSYIFIELKTAKRPIALIKKMLIDVNKINSTKTACYDGRSFWCVGFYTDIMNKDKINISDSLINYHYKYDDVIKTSEGDIGYIII